MVSIASHKQITVVVVASASAADDDEYDYGDYDYYYDAAAVPSSDVLMGIDVSRLIRPKIL